MKANPDGLIQSSDDLQTIMIDLFSLKLNILKVNGKLSFNILAKQKIEADLLKIIENISKIESDILDMSELLKTAAEKYKYVENAIADKYMLLDQVYKALEKDYPLTFNMDGEYGGDQGSPSNQYSYGDKMMSDIVRKYYPDYSDAQVKDYLDKLNSEGCGYVALVNTLFKQYEGKEEEFEKTFGFPMYNTDSSGSKHLNFNYMVTDFYAAKDNHHQRSFLFFNWDERDDSDDKLNKQTGKVEGSGTTLEDREYRWETYMKEHDIDTDVKEVAITMDNFNEYSKKGDIIIAISPVWLENELGELEHKSTGGHAMTVTGVTDDGRYIVSSWGKRYYVNPDQIKEQNSSWIQFQQVTYK